MKLNTTLCVALLAGLTVGFVAQAQESREVTKSVPLPKDGHVSIDTYKGSVNVDTWDKAEVSIVARIEADGWGRYDEEKVRDTEIRIDAGSNSVSIETDYKKIERRRSFWDIFDGEFGTTPFVHYTIKMPSTAKLQIKDYKSEINVNNLRSDLVLDTYKGEVDVRSLSGGLDLETYKGECKVEFAAMSSESRCETYKGEIRITIPSNAGFELDADVGRRGDFDSDFQFASSRAKRSRSDSWYSGAVNGGGPVLKLRTDKGTFRLIHR
jgi:hypothetical protein